MKVRQSVMGWDCSPAGKIYSCLLGIREKALELVIPKFLRMTGVDIRWGGI